MVRALLCREMHWTWQEYDEQPTFFITTLLALMKAEGEAIKRKQ